MKESSPKVIHLEEYTPPPFFIETADLYFDLHDDATLVTARLKIVRNKACVEAPSEIYLNGEGLLLKSISRDGNTLSEDLYRLDERGLTILQAGDEFYLETVVEIHPENNTALEGLYRSSGNYCTQCEAEGFRKITYYLDRPDVMAVFTTTIEADETAFPVLLSNGNPVEKKRLGKGRHSVRWVDPFRKPSYLFALVAGDLAITQGNYRTMSGREVRLQIYTEHHNRDRTAHALQSLIRAMQWDEETYGLEYDLDIYMIVAVDDFNMGAMENKGLNIFNSKFVLARPDTATDTDYVNIEAVIAHEYFHNWTGNRITCRDWFQLSLKEGLTVFRDQCFTADMTSAAVKRIDDVRALRSHQFPEDASPMAHPVRPSSYMEINNFYTLTVYEKGAEVVRMYQTLLGKEGFRKGMDLYFQRHDGQAVTTDDFRQAMADANGVDLSLFQRWYEQAGTPEVTLKSQWDESSGTFTLAIRQTCPPTPESSEKKPYLIPMKLGLLDHQGNDLPLKDLEGEALDDVISLTEASQTVAFSGLGEKPVPSLFRGFSAPVKIHYEYTDEELAFLMANDNDAFNRWDAGQSLYMRNLLSMIRKLQHGEKPVVSPVLLSAVESLLLDKAMDPALLAEAIILPDEVFLGEQMETIDVDAIHAAREQLKQCLAREFQSQWEDIYRQSGTPGKYKIDAASIGKRRLKNIALDYLLETGGEAYQVLALEQYSQADNMTDCMGAMQALKNGDSPQREKVLEDFYNRWQDDALVLDKWFTVQATSSRPDTLDRVKSLMGNPAFSISNPNRVRSLIGAFMQANPAGFHRRDGAGYEFAMDIIMRLDDINPQIAARLAKVFSRWQRYDKTRQASMQRCLRRIADKAHLSADVFEIVSNSLG